MRSADGEIIELLELAHPETTGGTEREPANKFGFHELAFTVDDVDATARALVAAGGRSYAGERSTVGGKTGVAVQRSGQRASAVVAGLTV